MLSKPTRVTYEGLEGAYDFFNQRLFGGKLPPCLITMQRKANSRGYFAGKRFTTRDEREITDEIALNPALFHGRTSQDILSTLVHEMVYLQQHHFGEPSRSGYHNGQWAQMMRAVGLIPSHNGLPGGRETGQKVSHYIQDGGLFDRACTELLASGCDVRYMDHLRDTPQQKKKGESKTKFTCPVCGLNAWAKPDAKLVCYQDMKRMRAPGDEAEPTSSYAALPSPPPEPVIQGMIAEDFPAPLPSPPSQQLTSAHKVGDRIHHKKFGYGTVEAVKTGEFLDGKTVAERTALTIRFDTAGKKRVVDRFVVPVSNDTKDQKELVNKGRPRQARPKAAVETKPAKKKLGRPPKDRAGVPLRDEISLNNQEYALVDEIMKEGGLGLSRGKTAILIERRLGREHGSIFRMFLGHRAAKLGINAKDMLQIREAWVALKAEMGPPP